MSGFTLPLGRYVPVSSPVHRLDPRVKLLATLGYVVALFLVAGWAGLGLLAAGLAAVAVGTRVPPGLLWRALRPLLILVAFTIVFQAFGYPGEPVLELGPLTVTREGILQGAFFGSRLVLLLMASALLTFSTTAVGLTDAVEWALRPLGRLGLNSHELALMMTIALRFIPTLLEEFGDLVRAQRARGVELTGRNPGRLVRALLPLAVPLFVIGFRRADDLAIAMTSRCYRGGEGRTRYRELTLGGWDVAAAGLVAGWLALAVLWGRVA